MFLSFPTLYDSTLPWSWHYGYFFNSYSNEKSEARNSEVPAEVTITASSVNPPEVQIIVLNLLILGVSWKFYLVTSGLLIVLPSLCLSGVNQGDMNGGNIGWPQWDCQSNAVCNILDPDLDPDA